MTGEFIVIEVDDRDGVHYVNVSAVFEVDVSHLPREYQEEAAQELVQRAMFQCREDFKRDAPNLEAPHRVH